jgi:hypothetical protein
MSLNSKRIALGSGDCYLAEVTSSIDLSDIDTVLNATFKTENQYGETKNGATLSYSAESNEVVSDLGKLRKRKMNTDSASLGWGNISIGAVEIAPMVATARTVTTESGKEVLVLGGLDNDNGKRYMAGFRHIDKADGDIYVVVTGKNTAELSMAFTTSDGTILNPSFSAESMDNSGALVYIFFDKPGADSFNLSSASTSKTSED